jgi:hypothetical protein
MICDISRAELVVLGPLALQRPRDLALGLGVDDVDVDRVRLPKALEPVDGLDEVVELVSMPTKTAVWQCAGSCSRLPAISGFVERYWNFPSLKSMIACSRSSRSCEP